MSRSLGFSQPISFFVYFRAKQEICVDAVMALRFLEIFTRVAEIPRSYLGQFIPDSILNQYEFLSGSSRS